MRAKKQNKIRPLSGEPVAGGLAARADSLAGGAAPVDTRCKCASCGQETEVSLANILRSGLPAHCGKPMVIVSQPAGAALYTTMRAALADVIKIANGNEPTSEV